MAECSIERRAKTEKLVRREKILKAPSYYVK